MTYYESGGDILSRYNYFDDDYDADSPRDISSEIKEHLKNAKDIAIKGGRQIRHFAQNVAENNPIDRIPKSKRLIICLVSVVSIIIITAALIFTFVHSINQENKKTESFNINASKICSQYSGAYGNCSYEGMFSRYGVDGYMMTGLCYARQLDFDNDSTSELLLCYNDGGIYYIEVWGFDDDKEFVSLYHEKANQTKDKETGAWITLYRHSNRYYIGVHDEDNLSKVSLYTLKNSKFSKKSSCEYDMKNGGFAIKGKDRSFEFERIRLSVLREASAAYTAELVTQIIDDFGNYSGEEIKKSTSNDIMKREYYSIIQDYNQKYGVAKYVEENGLAYIDGLAYVNLIDFDADKRDELVLVYRRAIRVRDTDRSDNYILYKQYEYYCDIYKFNGNKAVLVHKNEGLSQMLNDKDDIYLVLKKQNDKYYFCTNTFFSENYARHVKATSKIYSFNGETFVQKFKAHYEDNYGYSRYYIDDQQVSKVTFDEKGYRVALFNGSTEYDENAYSVVYMQRKSKNADNLKEQVNKTVSAIRELSANYNPDEM